LNNSQAFAILVSIGITISVVLLLIPAQSDDTIFFIKEDGSGAPTACTGNLGLVLAQNITDLCDVTIISPSTNQIIEYNGSQWVNVAHASFSDTTTCNNIGTGTAYVCVEGTNVNLRSILASTGISVSNNSNTITITNTDPETTVCNNQTTGQGLCIDDTIELKNLLAGSSISLSSNSTHITITNTAPDNTV